MGELMRPVFTRASRHDARPFQRKSATVSAQLLCKSATVSAQKRDRFSVDNFSINRRNAGVMHRKGKTRRMYRTGQGVSVSAQPLCGCYVRRRRVENKAAFIF